MHELLFNLKFQIFFAFKEQIGAHNKENLSNGIVQRVIGILIY